MIEALLEALTGELRRLNDNLDRAMAGAGPNKDPIAAAAAATKAPAATTASPKAEPAPTAIAYETCRDALKAVSAKFGPTEGRQKAVDILGRYGIAKLPELDPGRYVEFVAHCEAVLAGGEP